MATQILQLVHDNSTLANFKGWAKAISDWFRSCGWTNSSDTGQVDWNAIAAVPSSSWTAAYEIFQPGDGGTNFYLRIEYGYSTTNVGLRLAIGTGTSGAGTLTGFVGGPLYVYGSQGYYANTSATLQYECRFAGDSGRIGVLMWRNSGNWAPFFFGVERVLDTSGAKTATGVVLYAVGCTGDTNWTAREETLIFGKGAFTINRSGYTDPGFGAICSLTFIGTRGYYGIIDNSSAFCGNVAVFPVYPFAGKVYPPSTVFMTAMRGDFAEGIEYAVEDPYGVARTYLATECYPLRNFHGSDAGSSFLMRWD